MKNFKSIIPLTLFCFITCSCSTENTAKVSNAPDTLNIQKEVEQQANKTYTTFERQDNVQKLKAKIDKGTPITIHLLVPLCDNKNQGIVPVSRKLGNGRDLRNNLYWGAMYGIKNYFKNKSSWTFIRSSKNIDNNILERIILYREYPNKAKTYLIADAYRGDKMKACLADFLNSVAGIVKEEIIIEEDTIKLGSHADLLVFNGHNGLMDYEMEFVETADEKVRDVAVIGCVSHKYFVDHLKHAKGYPLLMTTNLMTPEAYVANSLIDSWIMLKEENEIKEAIGKSYHKYQKCGLKGASRLFRTGW